MLEKRVLHVYRRPTVGQRRGAEKTIDKMKIKWIQFDGYYKSLEDTPNISGVYLIYAVYYDRNMHDYCGEIVYIGQSDDVHRRLCEHEKEDKFQNLRQSGYNLWYSCAEISGTRLLSSVENALICSRKPLLNENWVDAYTGDPIIIIAAGKCLDLVNHNRSDAEPFTIIVSPIK